MSEVLARYLLQFAGWILYCGLGKEWRSDPNAQLRSTENCKRYRLAWQLKNGPLPPYVPQEAAE